MSSWAGAKEVPAISLYVQEDGDLPILLKPRGGEKLNIGFQHSAVSRIEVVDAEEQTHSSRKLLAHSCALILTIGLGEK